MDGTVCNREYMFGKEERYDSMGDLVSTLKALERSSSYLLRSLKHSAASTPSSNDNFLLSSPTGNFNYWRPPSCSQRTYLSVPNKYGNCEHSDCRSAQESGIESLGGWPR